MADTKGKPANNSPEAQAPRSEDRAETGRTKRVPMGTPTLKMEAVIRPGFVGHWFNDQNGRLQLAQGAGYEFAEDQSQPGRDKKRKMQVGSQDGKPTFAYLMEIRQEFYDEDQALKMAPLDEMDAQMRRGQPHGVAEGERGTFYDAGTQVTTST